MVTRYGTRVSVKREAADAAQAGADAGMTWDGTDLEITGNLALGDNKVIKFDDAEAVTIGYESATSSVEYSGRLSLDGSVVINESGTGTADFRVESDTNTHGLFCDSSQNVVSIGADISGMPVEATTDLIVSQDIMSNRNLLLKGLCIQNGGGRVASTDEYVVDADHGFGAEKESLVTVADTLAANITMPECGYGDDTTDDGRIVICNNVDSNNTATITGAREGDGDEDEIEGTTGGYAIAQGKTVAFIFSGGPGSTPGPEATEGSWSILWEYDSAHSEGFAFKTVAVGGQSDIVADTATDTLTFASGSQGVEFTTNAGTDTITLSVQQGDTLETSLGADSDAFEDDDTFANNGDTSGEQIYFLETTTVAGKLYYMTAADWVLTDADAAASATGKICIAVGTDSGPDYDGDGMLEDGYVRLNSGNYTGSAVIGAPVYIDTATPGFLTFTIPSGSTDIVRICGYCMVKDGSNHILVRFKPSSEWIELA